GKRNFLFDEKILDLLMPAHAERLKAIAGPEIAHGERPGQSQRIETRFQGLAAGGQRRIARERAMKFHGRLGYEHSRADSQRIAVTHRLRSASRPEQSDFFI